MLRCRARTQIAEPAVSLILSWALFPLALAAIGLGWGVIVERVSGARVSGALLLPLGLAAALVVAGTMNAFSATAAAAVPAVAVGAPAGLLLAWAGEQWPGRWPLLAAGGTLLAYGAPVLLSGTATFAGFVRLDDTATWFNVIDHLFSHGHTAGENLPSSYSLAYETGVGPHYPRGAFILPGLGRELIGVDVAWVFQPYLACCGAAAALCIYALIAPVVSSARVRALVAFLAAQSALLYGYSLWGGVKELTAAFLLALVAALAAAIIPRRPARPGELLPLAVAAGALVQTLGAGAAAWVAFTFMAIAGFWLLFGWRAKELWASVASLAWLGGMTAALMVPVWIVLGDFLSTDSGLFSSGQSEATRLGNLTGPLSGFQLAGIWPVGDFRLTPPELPTVLLIGLALLAALGALWLSARRREYGLPLYVAVALGGCGLIYLIGATPWVVGKTLAISAPALLAAALTGGAMLWSRRRAGVVILVLLAGGVLWSNALAYRDVLLAPRARLAELQHIGGLLSGDEPTLLNEYEIYGNVHFLRAGAPVGPADYRPVQLALRDGTLLTKSAWADLDSFPLATLETYPSIVTRRSPAESRPPSNYERVWHGDYYDLWQRREGSSPDVLEHIPFGESNANPFCGQAQNAEPSPECSVNPVSIPPCDSLRELGRRAAARDARLIAYQRPGPIVARGDQTVWPGLWLHDPAAHALTARAPGEAVSHIGVSSPQQYELWLGGSFSRGFEVSVDGRRLGTVSNELSSIGGYVSVGTVFLDSGVHEVTVAYPNADLSPGSGDNWFTSLSAITLQPHTPPSELITVSPQDADRLCGRPLDWVEVVVGAG
jgi:hypothetical protein